MARRLEGGGSAFGGKPSFGGGATRGSGTKSDPFRKAKKSRQRSSGSGGGSGGGDEDKKPIIADEVINKTPNKTIGGVSEDKPKLTLAQRREQEALLREVDDKGIELSRNERLALQKGASAGDVRDFINARLRFEGSQTVDESDNFVMVNDRKIPVSRRFAQKVQRDEQQIKRVQERERARQVAEFAGVVGGGGVSSVGGGAQAVTPSGENIALVSSVSGGVRAVTSSGRDVTPMTVIPGRGTVRPTKESFLAGKARRAGQVISPRDQDFFGSFGGGVQRGFFSPVSSIAELSGADPVGQVQRGTRIDPAFRAGQLVGIGANIPSGRLLTTAFTAGARAIAPTGARLANALKLSPRVTNALNIGTGVSVAVGAVALGAVSVSSIDDDRARRFAIADLGGQVLLQGVGVSQAVRNPNVRVQQVASGFGEGLANPRLVRSFGSFSKDFKRNPLVNAQESISASLGRPQSASNKRFPLEVEVLSDGSLRVLRGNIERGVNPSLLGGGIPRRTDPRSTVLGLGGTVTERPGVSGLVAEGGELVTFASGSPEFNRARLLQARAQSKATGRPSPDRLIANLDNIQQAQRARIRQEFAGVEIKFNKFTGRKGSQQLTVQLEKPKSPITIKKITRPKFKQSQISAGSLDDPILTLGKSKFASGVTIPGFALGGSGEALANINTQKIFSNVNFGFKPSSAVSSKVGSTQLFGQEFASLQGVSAGAQPIPKLGVGAGFAGVTALGLRQFTSGKTPFPKTPSLATDFPGGGGSKSGRRGKKLFNLDPSKFVPSVTAISFKVKRKKRKVSSKFFTGFEVRGI